MHPILHVSDSGHLLSQVCTVLSFKVAYQKVLLVAGSVTTKLRPLPTASVMKAELERRSSEGAVPRVHRTLHRYPMAELRRGTKEQRQ